MDKRTERSRLLSILQEQFVAAGRDDVKGLTPPRFYRYILKEERRRRDLFKDDPVICYEPKTPVEFMSARVFSINRHNARRDAYARGDATWNFA